MYIVHISSVHSADDPRIRRRELGSVVARGWRAELITGDQGGSGGDGVVVTPVPPGRSRRWLRVMVTAPAAVLKALARNAHVYHLHDPELLPWAWVLRLKGVPVVYDIHEDYVTSLAGKPYLPPLLRSGGALLVSMAEGFAAAFFHPVIAEKYYARRFPDALPLLNYPPVDLVACGKAFSGSSRRLLYTGNVTADRGALQMARLLRNSTVHELTVAGYCPSAVAAAMRREAGHGAERLRLVGEGRYLPFDEIRALYGRGGWLAGLALFPESDHYRDKELTKFFEYMAVGLPIVASAFPTWKTLLEGNGVGICVDPDDGDALLDALEWLGNHPEEAREMGRRGRDLVKTRFNWEGEGHKLIAFYEALR